ncbi:DUF5954 family protein [Micromonospora sp. NPDC048839]
MSSDGEMPLAAVIRVQRRDDPVGAVTEQDAVLSAVAYPLMRIGAPLFGHAVELGDGRWQVHGLTEFSPQAARDEMAHSFRERLVETSDPVLAAELTTVIGLLDRERVDEIVADGRRHRIVRADTFARFGDEGPEPPRPTDLDPRQVIADVSLHDESVLVDPSEPTDVGEALLKVELLSAHYPRGQVPAAVYDDSVEATRSHPNGMLLPTRYAAAEWANGVWRPFSRPVATPQEAREEIAFAFRYIEPRIAQLSEDDTATYRRAADDLDASRANETAVLGRRFRVARIEAFLRFSPGGPERPRPSDYEPDTPSEDQGARLPE